MPSPKRLVWLKPQYIGDAIMALPLIDSLGEGVTVRAMPHVLEMMQDRAARVTFLPARKFSGFASLFAAVRELRRLKFDEAYLVDRSFRSAVAVRLAGIPVRVGHATEGRTLLLTHVANYSPTARETECGLDLARLTGSLPSVFHPTVTFTADELAAGAARRGRALLGVQPGARYAEKQYPLDKLLAAVKLFAPKGIAVFGGPEEKEDAYRFAAMLPEGSATVLTGKLTLRESMAAAAGLNAMVGSDTGFMHAVAATGAPTLTLFGPNPASKWAHHEAPHRHLAHPSGLMSEIPVDDVVANLAAMLG